MDLVAGFRFLREREVLKMVSLRSLGPSSSPLASAGAENVVFVCRPEVHLMDKVAEAIKRWEVF